MVAIGRLVMSTRERICAIEIEEGALVLNTLRTAEEVRAIDAIASPDLPRPDPQMLQIAEKIVEQQSGEFDPSEFRDRYEEALRALIDQKRKGKSVKPSAKPANDDTKVIDLMAALKRSLKGGGDTPGPARRTAALPSRRSPSPKRSGRSSGPTGAEIGDGCPLSDEVGAHLGASEVRMRIFAACITAAVAFPAAAFAQAPQQGEIAYCQALASIYVHYIGRPSPRHITTSGAAASTALGVAVRAGRTAEAIPVLERKLRNGEVDLAAAR